MGIYHPYSDTLRFVMCPPTPKKMTGRGQFRLLTWTSFIGQFVHSVGGVEVKGVILWREEVFFSQLQVSLRVHDNLV